MTALFWIMVAGMVLAVWFNWLAGRMPYRMVAYAFIASVVVAAIGLAGLLMGGFADLTNLWWASR